MSIEIATKKSYMPCNLFRQEKNFKGLNVYITELSHSPVHTRRDQVSFFLIAGGISLTVFGVRFLRKGFERLFGGRLVAWLSGLTERRWKAWGAGVVVGTLAPSSTAISLVTMQMLNVGQFTAERMFALLLGANLGITVTVQLMAFRLQDWAGAFLVAGVLSFQFMKREVLRGIGQCLLALGLVFLAMGMIGKGAAMINDLPETREWARLFAGHPLIVFLFVAALTALIQSSTASIGFALGLSAGGLFGVEMLLPWVLGANVGIGLTALGAGWGTLEGRRLACANLAAKVALALPLILFHDAPRAVFDWLPGSPMREIANFHSAFNLATGLIFVPLAAPLTRLMRWIIIPPPATGDLPRVESFLDSGALESPSLALTNAARETMNMADSVGRMLEYFWKGYEEGDPQLIQQVRREDDHVDRFYRDIKNYLSRIREGLGPEELQWHFAMMTFSNDLESAGDIVDKNLCDLFQKQRAEGVKLSSEDHAAVTELYQMVNARFATAKGLLANRGGKEIHSFLKGKESLNRWCREMEKKHYERLRHSEHSEIASSAYFLDLMEGLRRFNSHITSIGYVFRTAAGPGNPAGSGTSSG